MLLAQFEPEIVTREIEADNQPAAIAAFGVRADTAGLDLINIAR